MTLLTQKCLKSYKAVGDFMNQNRRQFMMLMGALGLYSVIPQRLAAQSQTLASTADPIQQLGSLNFQSFEFNGDNIDKPHEGLWNPDGVAERQGGWPVANEKQDLVIIGGGISGLLSAYYFRDRKPVVLELDKYFGGNSKGEVFNNSTYAIGAAYITVPEKDSEIAQFLQELDLFSAAKHEASDETVSYYRKKLMKGFWQGVTDPERAQDFISVGERLEHLYAEAYPDIPWSPESSISQAEFNRLDQMSFAQWLKQEFKNLHPHIEEFFELYSWSSFTATSTEISAAQMLNFILSELDGVLAFPGGNAAITQRLYDQAKINLGDSRLRTECLVIKVALNNQGALVYYMDKNNKLKAIQAKKVIMACQKFVAKTLCVDMPASQLKAIDQMFYRGYVVANAIYNKKIKSPGFDIFCFEGKAPEEPSAMRPSNRSFSDVVFANWAAKGEAKNTILTLYRPLPYDGARQFLFSPMAHEKHLKAIQDGLRSFEGSVGFQPVDLKGVRLTRWGHSLPVAMPGFLSSGLADKVNAPIGNTIFFANQDNWANPAFESSFAAVRSLLPLV